jgi:hypothetical protein
MVTRSRQPLAVCADIEKTAALPVARPRKPNSRSHCAASVAKQLLRDLKSIQIVDAIRETLLPIRGSNPTPIDRKPAQPPTPAQMVRAREAAQTNIDRLCRYPQSLLTEKGHSMRDGVINSL